MKILPFSVAACAASVVAAACAHDVKPPERAATVARYECFGEAGYSSPDEQVVLRNTVVLRADPVTFRAGESTPRSLEGGQTLSGTNMVVRSPEGITARSMQRILRCYNARALMGQADPAVMPDNPFYVPDTLIHIDVRDVDNGLMQVSLTANKESENVELYRRAAALADGRHVASQQ
jgi:hypothetical protein